MRRKLFQHYSEVPASWMAIAPNFSFAGDPKMVSADTGAFLYDPVILIQAQVMRDVLELPLTVNSWYRSPLLNAHTPGASPISEHPQGRAIDFSTRGRDRAQMYWAARVAGFTSFGFYKTFIHVGTSGKRWFGSHEAKRIWTPLLNNSIAVEL